MSENLSIFSHYCPTRLSQELLIVRLLKQYNGQPGIIFTPTKRLKADLLQLFHNFHLFHKAIIVVIDSEKSKPGPGNARWTIYLQPPQNLNVLDCGQTVCHILITKPTQKMRKEIYYAGEDWQCFTQLIEKRQILAKKLHKPEALITPTTVLKWLALLQPQTPTDFACIPGIGQGWIKKYFHEFLLD